MNPETTPIEAREKLVAAFPEGPEPEVPPLEAVGEILAIDVQLPRSEPPHPLSAMDGFAVRREDVPGTVDLVADSTPGAKTPKPLEPGTTVRSLTGGPTPENADVVVPIERVREKGQEVHIPSVPSGSNIVPAGKAVQAGERISAGRRLGPGLAETLASQRVDRIPVRALPQIKIVPLGDELVDGTVTDTVAPLLEHLLAREPGAVERSAPRPDREEVLDELMDDPAPIVITTGGTGPSQKDRAHHYTPDRRLFHGVNVKPGKPLQARRRDEEGVWIALPGNPTSALFTFRALVLPALRDHLAPERCTGPSRAVHRVAEPLEGHQHKWKIVPVRLTPQGLHPLGEGPSLSTGWWRNSDGLVLLQPATSLETDARAEVMFW